MLQKLIPVITFPAQNLKGKYCLSPFVQINIDTDGHVGICGCATWQPTRIGNIFEHSLTDLLSGTMAQRIRQSIIDGTYTYCDPDKCGILKTNGLNTAKTLSPQVAWAVEDSVRFLVPHYITLSMDRTCNLWCPSCRHAVLKNNYETKEQQTQLSALVARNLFGTPTDQRIVLTLDTGGDLFASAFMLDFLANISSKDFPNLEIDILSNGLLCEDRWHRMGDMQDHVKKITISYDAAEAKTYEKLRRGGAWSNIMQAMRWLQDKKAQNGMQFNARMVVQRDNYKEMQAFYNLSKGFGCDSVQFQRIVNWGTFTADQFAQIDVYHKDSNLYADAMAQLELVSGLPDTEFWHGMPKIS